MEDVMSVHDRARRRQQRQQRAAGATNRPQIQDSHAPIFEPEAETEAAEIVNISRSAAPVASPAPKPVTPGVPAVGPRAARRAARPAPAPIDYTEDYRAVRKDLRWIALWSILLFGGMIALAFSGLV
jgi:hypothetical protein